MLYQTEVFKEMAAQNFPRDIVSYKERMRLTNCGSIVYMLIQKCLHRLTIIHGYI